MHPAGYFVILNFEIGKKSQKTKKIFGWDPKKSQWDPIPYQSLEDGSFMALIFERGNREIF